MCAVFRLHCNRSLPHLLLNENKNRLSRLEIVALGSRLWFLQWEKNERATFNIFKKKWIKPSKVIASRYQPSHYFEEKVLSPRTSLVPFLLSFLATIACPSFFTKKYDTAGEDRRVGVKSISWWPTPRPFYLNFFFNIKRVLVYILSCSRTCPFLFILEMSPFFYIPCEKVNRDDQTLTSNYPPPHWAHIN